MNKYDDEREIREDYGWEMGFLIGALKPHFLEIADIKQGYETLLELIEVSKLDFPTIDSQLNDYYVEIIRIIELAYENIEREIHLDYEQDSPNNYPADYINPHIFEGRLYFPYESLYQTGEASWSEIDSALNECLDRIKRAYSEIVRTDDVEASHKDFFQTVKGYLSNHNRYHCGDLVLDLRSGTLRYRDQKPVAIVIDTNEIKLLRLLFQHQGEILPYQTVAHILDLNSHNEETTGEEDGEKLRFLKGRLVSLLKKTGITSEDLQRVITVQRNSGYIMSCD